MLVLAPELMEVARRAWVAVAMALALVGLVAPLPAPMIDALVAGNVALAVLVMFAVVVRPRAALRTLPTWLLVLTALRIATTVAATRRILTHADAGGIVRGLGAVLTGHSLIVGLVVFLLIAVVQLVVIASGGERIAQVAARFALDALPGRLAALDAEVRGGTLDASAAAQRREALGAESSFLGAMDGALRLVRGEVVASLVVLLVGLGGGVAVGVTRGGLGASEALARFGLLTVGEAIATQLPALASTFAASVLVTRSDDGDELGATMASAMASRPLLLGAGAVVLTLGLVPGLPLVPFAVVGGALVGLGLAVAPSTPPSSWADLELVVPTPEARRGEAALADALEFLSSQLGVRPASSAVRVVAGASPALFLFGARHAEVALDPEAILASLEPVAHELVTLETLARDLDALRRAKPLALPARIPPREVLLEVLRALVRERVPVDDLAAIVEVVHDAPTAALVSKARVRLRRRLTRVLAPEGTLRVIAVDEALVSVLTAALRGDALALSRAASQDVAAAIDDALAQAGTKLVLLPTALRPHAAALAPGRGLIGVAAEELLPDVVVDVVAVARPK